VVASRDAGSINADPVRLQQVLLALVQNAVEAMQESGSEIALRTERRRTPPKGASAATDAQADYTVIMVQDDGPGLSADAKARLFEPYFTTKQAQRGLGLVTAYGIARQSGGTLDVQSAPGRGTTITIWLPRVSDDADIALVGRLRPVEEQLRQTILVVEDEESVRRLVRVVLEREGYRVLQATNGVEAMRLLEDPSLSLDILLTDVMMPQMGGRELAERLLAVQPDLSVIFMSGYVADRATLTGVAERKAPLLQKPFAIEDLVRVVRSTIEAARR
jgi:CheY-like chemotaxis protein